MALLEGDFYTSVKQSDIDNTAMKGTDLISCTRHQELCNCFSPGGNLGKLGVN
jgi:hypothetical protein